MANLKNNNMLKSILPIALILVSTHFSVLGQGGNIQKSTHTYAVKEGQELQLDVYKRPTDESGQPILIWMHGGGFAGGTRDNPAEVRLMEYAAERGYIAVSISYRLTRKGKSFGCDALRSEKMYTFKAAAEDLWDAIAYAHDKLGGNTQEIVIGGSSAGAEAVLIGLYMRDWLFEGEDSFAQIQPKAVFTLAGALIDVRYIRKENALPAVLFHGTDDNLVPYATAPHHYCDPDTPGYLILDGSRTLADRLKALGQAFQLYTFQDARHEISGIPFDFLDEVFEFLEGIGSEKVRQEEFIIPRK